MPNFRRYYIPNALTFVTCVTHQRYPWLKSDQNLALFWQTVRSVQTIHPFHLLAYVILPDHFHWILQTLEDQPNFSKVIHSVKRNYVLNYKRAKAIEAPVKLWQDRFWDHVILDEGDLERHCDYIHWNPLKHQHVQNPEDWKESSYRRWAEQGFYHDGWGCTEEPTSIHHMQIE